MNAPALIDPTLDQLAAEINAAHTDAQAFSTQAVERAHDAGIRLNQAKAQCQHGDWLPWLKTNCPDVSERTAQAYMQLARNWTSLESKSAVTADLTLDAALKLLSAPKAVKKSIQKRLPATPVKCAPPAADLPKPEPASPALPVAGNDWFDAPMRSMQPTVEPKSVKALQDEYLAFSDAMRAKKAQGLPEPVAEPEPQGLDLGFLDMPDIQQLDGRFNETLDRALSIPETLGFQRVLRPIEELRDFMPDFLKTIEQAQTTVDLLEILTQQARLRLAWLESYPKPQPTLEAQP